MKKKFLSILIAILAFCTCMFTLTACGGQDGIDGVSIVDVYVSDDGYLMIKYSNSNEYVNVGKVTGNKEQGTANLKYVLNPDKETVSVDGIGMAFETDIVIPSTYSGYKVTGITDNAFMNCTLLTSITIPDSVTSIGNSAFNGCSNLASIVIPNSVTSIGNSAFNYCVNLTSIVIPSSVTSIGDYAFFNCSSLTSVTFGENSKLTSIGDYAFFNCSSLTSVTFGENSKLTSIGNYAFSNCDSLTSITIGNSVTSIGNYAFSNCDSLTSIVIPNSVTSIGFYAFYYCSSLTSITFADTSTWYIVYNYTDLQNKTGGTQTDVTNPMTNVSNFKSNYLVYFWYKI